MRKTVLFFASGGGVGFIPGPQGTYGTGIGVLLVWALQGLGLWSNLVFLFTFTLFSIWVAGQAELFLSEKDSRKIVIDEVAGFYLTLFLVPFTWQWVIVGFLLFRAFDTIKPPPIRQFERKVKGGLGVVGDDLLAGLFANLILQVALFLL